MKIASEMTLATGHMMSLAQIALEMSGYDGKSVKLDMALDPNNSLWWQGVWDTLMLLITEAGQGAARPIRNDLIYKLNDMVMEERLAEFEGGQ